MTKLEKKEIFAKTVGVILFLGTPLTALLLKDSQFQGEYESLSNYLMIAWACVLFLGFLTLPSSNDPF